MLLNKMIDVFISENISGNPGIIKIVRKECYTWPASQNRPTSGQMPNLKLTAIVSFIHRGAH